MSCLNDSRYDIEREGAVMSRNRYLNVDLSVLRGCMHRGCPCKTVGTCCCAHYEVSVTAREMRAIIGVLPLAAKFCPWLKLKDGFENVFEEDDDGWVIETHENGLCVFAFRSRAGILCSLHCVAEHMGIRPASLKPLACTVWPFAVSAGSHPTLLIRDDAYEFPCNRRAGKRSRRVSGALLGIIEDLFGTAARERIVKAASKGLRHTKIPLGNPLASRNRRRDSKR